METRANYVAVGAFVLVLIVGLVGFVVWAGKFSTRQEFAYYDIRFRGAVTGLQVDGPVRYRGIPVGRVADIAIDEKNIELVRVTVEVKRGTPIHVDSVASLEVQGITGVAYVLISGGTQASKALPETTDKPYPVIASKPSKLEEFFEGAPDLVNRMNKLVDRVTLLFDARNQQAIGDTLDNIRAVTGVLAQNGGGIQEALKNGAAAADQIRSTSAEFERLARDLRGQVGKLGGDAQATAADLQKTAKSFTAAANQLDGILKDTRRPLKDFTSTGLYQASQLLTEMRQLVASLSRVSAQIERDPARFFFGDRRQGYEAR